MSDSLTGDELAMLEAIGRAVRVRRVAARLTQEELAHRAGVAVTTVQYVEQGGRKRRRDQIGAYQLVTLWRVVDALGLSLARFMVAVDLELGLRPRVIAPAELTAREDRP